MNPLLERYPELIGDQDDPALLACVAHLDATCAHFTLPPERDGALAHSLLAQAAQPRPQPAFSHRLAVPWRTARWRLASAMMAVLLAGSGIATFLHGSGPAPVDAQTVLHRAAAAGPGANEATHATYHVSSSDGHTGTADVWIGYDKTGAAGQLSLRLTMNGQTGASLDANVAVAGPGLLHIYQQGDGVSMTVRQVTPGQPAPGPTVLHFAYSPGQALKGIVVGTLLAQKLSRQPDAYKLQQETLDGVPVYALKLTGADSAAAGATFYFNAQSYVLEGADWDTQGGVSWTARLDPASYRIMPLSSVPANTFPAATGGITTGSAEVHAGTGAGKTLSPGSPAPGGVSIGISGGRSAAGAHLTITAQVDGPKGSSVDLTPALAAACDTTTQAFAAALQTGTGSILTACRQTNAGITADQLVTALLVPVQSSLDGLVRSGTITAAQETTDLSNLRSQLGHLLVFGAGMPPAGASTGQQPTS
jgi:hypothetical protein